MSKPQVALVSLTVAESYTYTDARCPECQRLLYLVPGEMTVQARGISALDEGTGRGRVVECSRCRCLAEVIEHG